MTATRNLPDERDGSNVRRLTNDGAEDINPAWSPDGLHLAFDTNRDGNYEIYVMDASGGTCAPDVPGRGGWTADLVARRDTNQLLLRA